MCIVIHEGLLVMQAQVVFIETQAFKLLMLIQF